MCLDPRYRVVCEARRYGGEWRVERVADGRVMTTNAMPYHCLEWVRVWGPMRTLEVER